MRINRFLARAGLGSRRGVEQIVRDGRVTIGSEVVTDLGRQVDPEVEEVRVDGRVVRPAVEHRVIVLNKPVGVVSSLRRQGDAPCLRDVLPSADRDLFHVGRLDRDSSGLLLMTNDGELSQRILHPRNPVWKRYEVSTDRPVGDVELEAWRAGGIPMDGRPLVPARVERGPGPSHLVLELREGRNRQIRRMVERAGAHVVSLHRTRFGPVDLGGLAAGGTRPVTTEEATALRELAGHAEVVDDPSDGA